MDGFRTLGIKKEQLEARWRSIRYVNNLLTEEHIYNCIIFIDFMVFRTAHSDLRLRKIQAILGKMEVTKKSLPELANDNSCCLLKAKGLCVCLSIKNGTESELGFDEATESKHIDWLYVSDDYCLFM